MAEPTPHIPFEDSDENIVPHLNNQEKHYGYWQLCPKCDGEGQVPNNGTSTSVYRICPVCNGAKILVRPGVPTHWREKQNKEV